MQNCPNLIVAVENLYSAFRHYPLDVLMSASFTVHESDKAELYTPSLRNLSAEQLSKYTLKAMTSWGGVNDFKHFLPRILELQSNADFFDTDLVKNKFDLAEFSQWCVKERLAINQFFEAYWEAFVANKHLLTFTLLTFIANFVDLGRLLVIWDTQLKSGYHTHAFIMLINFINDYSDCFSLNPNTTANQTFLISKWIEQQVALVERSFFECQDDELASKISSALQLYDFYNKT